MKKTKKKWFKIKGKIYRIAGSEVQKAGKKDERK